jgi:hypothetical protein
MLFNGRSRPDIIDCAKSRLNEGADTDTVAKELMNKWPYEVNEPEIANSVVVFAKLALRK